VSDVDPDTTATILATSRTHLANERTFAAWIRTGLSVAAAGVAVARASLRAETPTRLLCTSFIVLGSAMIVFGGVRFGRVAGAIGRAGSPTVRLARRMVYAMAALLAILVVSTFLVLV
jgi:putative membrane protein